MSPHLADLNRDLYLDLMKKVLLNLIYPEAELSDEARAANPREDGMDWPKYAHSMVGLKRLNNIELCLRAIVSDNIPGDLIETGVWRGGSCIFMRAILRSFNIKDRTVWVADSFRGLPKPNIEQYPQDTEHDLTIHDELSVGRELVENNFRKYDLLDEQVRFLEGWFKDTLPTAPISQLALLRLDGDLYESTMDALNSLYDKVAVGGFVIVDDYGALPPCKLAVDDFRRARGITDELIEVDWTGSFWRKSK